MKLYFWQNMVAMHQVHCLNSLAQRHEVHWLVDEELNVQRALQGWAAPVDPKIRVRTVQPELVCAILDAAPRDVLHVFAPRACATGPILVRELNRRRLRYAHISEIPDGRGLTLLLKRLLYRWLNWRCRHSEFMAAMGDAGAGWYAARGYKNTFPFGYTVEDSQLALLPPAAGVYRFIIVARLIPLKQHQLLMRALMLIPGDWVLEIVGQGPLQSSLMELALKLGLSNKITWIEALPNAEARTRISQSDTLVLCSEWEGWGAVVNEAIAEGSRVVVSDVCGAACLLNLGDVGESFSANDVRALADCLRRQMARGRVSVEERRARRALHTKINGPAMAAYFEQIVSGNKPSAPWSSRSSE